MSKKSRQRKSHDKRPSDSSVANPLPIAPAHNKPWQIASVCIILAVVTIFVFRDVRTNDFVSMDDFSYVLENQQVHQGLTAQSIAWAFTTFYNSNWHPLTWISHMLDWRLYGNNPAGHHITNLCLHAANAIILFLLLLYITGYMGRSAIVAFLFALHPAHVESVAWIAERKDVLCAFFWLATMFAYAWYVRKPSWKRFLWVICGFALGLMSKPMIVTLPFTLLLLDYWPFRRITFAPQTRWFSSFCKLCVEKWPLFIMAIISSVITFNAQRAGGSVAALQAIPFGQRICNAAISYCRYLRILFWPDPLTSYYYYDRAYISVAATVLSILALTLVTYACWHFRKSRPYCITGWMWFLGTLVPVIGIIQVGDQAMAERYSYLPSIGIFLAVVWLAADAVANSPKIKVAAQLFAVAVIVACAIKTNAQVKVWKNSMTLFSHALLIDPRGERPNLRMGMAYATQGNLAEAEKYFARSLVYDPYNPSTLSYSAHCLMQTHQRQYLPLAKKRLDLALSVAPNDVFALSNMALWSSLMGKPNDEEMYSRKAIASQPDLLRHGYILPMLSSRRENLTRPFRKTARCLP